jgi:uncharacterized membrane-anchored protein
MVDYSHPRYYMIIGIFSAFIALLMGIIMQRGFYIGVFGMVVFTYIYYAKKQDYDRTERGVLAELVLSLLGFVFLPLMFIAGLTSTIIPTTLDALFFLVGFSTIMLTTSLLYLLEPENYRQLSYVLIFGIFIQILIMFLIDVMTQSSFMGGLTH